MKSQLVPADPDWILLLDKYLVLNTKPILAMDDSELYLQGVKGTVAYSSSEPAALFRLIRNLASSVLEIEERFGDDAEDWYGD